MANQHVVDITINWPDSLWEGDYETEYLISCLKGVMEHFQAHPLQNKEAKLTLTNFIGRVYAEIHVNPCK